MNFSNKKDRCSKIIFILASLRDMASGTMQKYCRVDESSFPYIKFCLNVSTNPLQEWVFWQCLHFSWTTLRVKHCRHPIVVMEPVDTFGLYQAMVLQSSKQDNNFHCLTSTNLPETLFWSVDWREQNKVLPSVLSAP